MKEYNYKINEQEDKDLDVAIYLAREHYKEDIKKHERSLSDSKKAIERLDALKDKILNLKYPEVM